LLTAAEALAALRADQGASASTQPGFRVYSDEEIDEFLAEDAITPETADRVRALMRAGLV
jgi:hypothetical protein